VISDSVAAPARKEFTQEERAHWAFQPMRRPAIPEARSDWARSPIDHFILHELRKKGLAPNSEADRATLLRRASLGITGLPPAPEEVDVFLQDGSPKAWETAVDRLLSSPHYGERWARHWLDLARYAESEGFKADETRPNAWRYRDYVIRSLNDDKPYDRFVQEQIAGDELWPEQPDALVATGFNRHYPDESNARNLMQRRQEILNDVTDTVGAVFTGLTFGCARCHDHKFDPIRQEDYFRLQAFFANTAAADTIPLLEPERLADYRRRLAIWEEKTAETRAAIAAIEEPKRQEIIKDYVDKYPEEIQLALTKPAGDRTAFEAQMVAKARLYVDTSSHQYIASSRTVAARLKPAEKERWAELQSELKSFEPLHPGPLPLGTGMVDLSNTAPPTYLLGRGNWDAPEHEVGPGFLQVLQPVKPGTAPVQKEQSTGRRAALALWLTGADHPLTARVIVNRVWQYHFGKGLVGTASDFGFKGDRPTHPELLDWLAQEFVRGGWSLKRLHRLILSSSAYRQSSAFREQAAERDPENALLWRFPRQRLEAEVIRDAALSVSGRLNPKMGGPSIFPELPPGMESRGGWPVTADLRERDRRSIYVFVRRNTRYPFFESFDMPDTHESCARRNITTSPVQALSMLNSELTLDWARSFAARVMAVTGSDRREQIVAAYRFAYGRRPNPDELDSADAFLARHEELIQERLGSGEPVALPSGFEAKAGRAEAAGLVDFCHVLLNSNEFVYRN
jgi:hypothetical protein